MHAKKTGIFRCYLLLPKVVFAEEMQVPKNISELTAYNMAVRQGT
jgi:hypothetical protein